MITTIQTTLYKIHIEEDRNGKTQIRLEGIGIRKADLFKLDISARDAGLPGISGPDIEFNVGEVVEKINEEAAQTAESKSWYNRK